MIMGCEGVSAAMLLQYNHHNIKATDIMKHWPTHPNNPYKGYVGHHLLVKFGHHQTIFPSAYVPYLQTFDSRIVDGTGTNLEELETVIDQGQPILMYHTSLGQNLHVKRLNLITTRVSLCLTFTLHYLLDMTTHITIILILYGVTFKKNNCAALVPNRFQIIKIKKNSWSVALTPLVKMYLCKTIIKRAKATAF